jgi:hypothetical protein
MACKQVIVLPPEIPMIYGSPAHIQTFIGNMVPAIREVIAADPLSTKYGVEVEYIVTDFIQFMMARSKHARSRWDPHSRWERYNRKLHPKGKKPYPTWFLHRLRKYLSDHRATLVNLPRKTGADRVPSHTKLVVVYLQPTNTAPRSEIRFSL